MLLWGIIKHVKDQNWTAGGLDFAIVVTGVFIGIQVSNWNDMRREHALDREYLERLSIDIQLSVQRAEMNIDSHEQQIAWQSVMLEALERCTLDQETRADFARGVIINLELRREIPTDGPFSMSDLLPDMVSFDFSALREDPRYASAVSTIRFTTGVTLSHHRQMLERYESLLRMLARE